MYSVYFSGASGDRASSRPKFLLAQSLSSQILPVTGQQIECKKARVHFAQFTAGLYAALTLRSIAESVDQHMTSGVYITGLSRVLEYVDSEMVASIYPHLSVTLQE
jgi:hypothetical protein